MCVSPLISGKVWTDCLFPNHSSANHQLSFRFRGKEPTRRRFLSVVGNHRSPLFLFNPVNSTKLIPRRNTAKAGSPIQTTPTRTCHLLEYTLECPEFVRTLSLLLALLAEVKCTVGYLSVPCPQVKSCAYLRKQRVVFR